MAKRKPQFKIESYGIYKQWDADAKELPRIAEFTTSVRAELGVEFGFVVNIKGAKNKQLEYCIYHPGIRNEQGDQRPPFDLSLIHI